MRLTLWQTARNPAVENWLILPVVVALTGMAAYWATVVDRTPPIQLYDGTISPQKVSELGFITVRWRVEVLSQRPWSATINRDIRDAAGTWHRIDQQDVRDAQIESAAIARTSQIPRRIAWGPATYHLNACYRRSGFSLTPIWPVCVRWPELPFEIVRSAGEQ